MSSWPSSSSSSSVEWSDHTIALRKALQYSQVEWQQKLSTCHLPTPPRGGVDCSGSRRDSPIDNDASRSPTSRPRRQRHRPESKQIHPPPPPSWLIHVQDHEDGYTILEFLPQQPHEHPNDPPLDAAPTLEKDLEGTTTTLHNRPLDWTQLQQWLSCWFVHSYQRTNDRPVLIRGLVVVPKRETGTEGGSFTTNTTTTRPTDGPPPSFDRLMQTWSTGSMVRQWMSARFHRLWLCPLLPVVHWESSPDSCHQYDKDKDNATTSNTIATTRWIPWSEWIDYLNKQEEAAAGASVVDDCTTHENHQSTDQRHNHEPCKDYLKDWHLVQWLEDAAISDQNSDNSTNDDDNEKNVSLLSDLFQVPDWVAGNDLWNPFLQQFYTQPTPVVTKSFSSLHCARKSHQASHTHRARRVDRPDYRFVYWGPAHSSTPWHVDVLQSFSWSWNVYGTKQWTFECPPSNRYEDHEKGNSRQFSLLQQAGELVWVPSTWRHQVVNLVETLSINRNWITWTQLEPVWSCLQQEIKEIDKELQSWQQPQADDTWRMGSLSLGGRQQPRYNSQPNNAVSNQHQVDHQHNNDKNNRDYWRIRESMLRGCTGMDLTTFVLILVVRLLRVLEKMDKEETNQTSQWKDEKWQAKEILVWRRCLHQMEVQTLSFMLQRLTMAGSSYGEPNDTDNNCFTDRICLQKRMAAILESSGLAQEAMDLIHSIVDRVLDEDE